MTARPPEPAGRRPEALPHTADAAIRASGPDLTAVFEEAALGLDTAIRALRSADIGAQLRRQGIEVRAERRDLLAEEASLAYKDVADVVDTSVRAGLVRSVARLRPLAVIKG